MTKGAHFIKGIMPGSIAEEMGIQPGDMLLRINKMPVRDFIDYRYLINEEYIEVLVRKASGEEWLLEVDKDLDEDLGFVFEEGLMDKGRRCVNKCIFCFIDQLPEGMRDTLYFKDDDLRMSFLQGNFISLTNLKTEDIKRIIKYRISPLNISVHTTDPQLRKKMLGNPRAGETLKLIPLFVEHGIVLNCQIVLCPGINDGESLERTLDELGSLGPGIGSIGVVPVGITKFRKGLYPIKPFGAEDAAAAIKTVEERQKLFLKRYGSRIVYAADELYLKAGLPIPSAAVYEGFPQLENGIGMMALFRKQFDEKFQDTAFEEQRRIRVSVVTGRAAYSFIKGFADRIEKIDAGIRVNVYPITNHFFGQTIDVAGLVTGRDIIKELQGKDLGDRLIIPQNMLRSGEDVFLDDTTVIEVQNSLDTRIRVCEIDGGKYLKSIIQGEKP